MTLLSRQNLIVFVLAVLILVPIPFERVPEFRFTVVDVHDEPLSGVTVIEDTDDYTYNAVRERRTSVSGNNGEVVLPAKKLWMSLGYRLLQATFARLMLLAHGSIGVHTDIFVMEDDDYWPTNVARWNEDCDTRCDISQKLTALSKHEGR